MDSMKCWDCTLKHLAAAVGYAKEVMSGHTKGNELDHRIDFLGEVVNAEHHAENLDAELFTRISELRKYLQSSHVEVNTQVIDKLRGLYIMTEDAQTKEEAATIATDAPKPLKSIPPSGVEYKLPIKPPRDVMRYVKPLDVVYMSVTDLDYFRFSYNSLKQYLTSYNNIYVLKTELDLTEFGDVKVADRTLLEICKDPDLTTDFLLVQENEGWINIDNAFVALPHFTVYNGEQMRKAKQEADRLKLDFFGRMYDNIKPQPVNKDKYVELMTPLGDVDYPLTHYYNQAQKDYTPQISLDSVAVVDRPVCCSTRGKLRTYRWAMWTNKTNFESMVKFLDSIGAPHQPPNITPNPARGTVRVFRPGVGYIDPKTGEPISDAEAAEVKATVSSTPATEPASSNTSSESSAASTEEKKEPKKK